MSDLFMVLSLQIGVNFSFDLWVRNAIGMGCIWIDLFFELLQISNLLCIIHKGLFGLTYF
jgi:hypothetical protein